MEQLIINMPQSFVYDSKVGTEEVLSRIRTEAAIELYTHYTVSFGYCAQIAGMPEEDFIRLLGEHQIGIFDYMDENELTKDFENVQAYYKLVSANRSGEM